ncbi:MAG: zinc ribbon domain-containing protein [Acidobacteria bacterium]|nr:zinc ribbon domain-containing protein [Acidobacteriota bacterium]
MMLTCPNCGAENKEGSPFCRMCAASLDNANLKGGAANAYYQSPPLEVSTQISCPACKTLNDADWAFCQECGYKLSAARPRTEPVQTPASPPPFAQETVIVDDMKTVAVNKITTPNPASTIAESRPVQEASPVSFEPRPAPLAKTVVHVAPKDLPPPPAEPPAKPVAPLPPPELITAPDIHAAPLDYGATIIDTGSQLASQLHGNEIACPKCAHKSAAGSQFCANCGAPVSVSATIVMSSMPATPKGRLHLVMEGGQPGEVYDLKDETAIGRTLGDIAFPHDGYMSSRHARIMRRGEDFVLVDEGSRNGTFIRIKNEVKLESGDMILIGKQLFRFEK